MKSPETSPLELPPRLPVMFLPNSVLLPHVLLPLYIFEPRYRAMLEHALQAERMFCLALMQPGIEEVATDRDFHPIAGVGLVRACVGREDGTSHLVLQGLGRVNLGKVVQQQPFKILEARELASLPTGGPEVSTLAEQIKALAAKMMPESNDERDRLTQQLSEIQDPGVLCDVVAHTFIRSPQQQQQILEALDVASRARLLSKMLQAESTG